MKKLALGALLIGLVAACGGGDGKVKLVDASGVDAQEVCSPLMQTGCAADQKCAWNRDQNTPTPLGHLACVANGTVAIDGKCKYGMPGPAGFSDCVKGSECVNGVCKAICDNNGGAPKCDENHACSQYDGLFEMSDVTVAGVCDAKCDPRTQALLAGSPAAACGSTDPAAPSSGCYTFDVQNFTCAGVPQEITAKRASGMIPVTDRQPAF